MANVRKMNSDLVFAPGMGNYPEQREAWVDRGRRMANRARFSGTSRVQRIFEGSFDDKVGSSFEAVGAHAIFDRHNTCLVFAQTGCDGACWLVHPAMNNRQVLFGDLTGFPESTGGAGSRVFFRDKHHATGFAVQAI